MSLDACKTCRYVGYCALPQSRVITKCEQYEDMRSAPSFDWNLQDLVKLRDSGENAPENPG